MLSLLKVKRVQNRARRSRELCAMRSELKFEAGDDFERTMRVRRNF